MFEAVLRFRVVLCSLFTGKVPGGARSSPALQEPTAAGWAGAGWRIALPALPEPSAPLAPPNRCCAQCKCRTTLWGCAGTRENVSLWRFRALLVLIIIFLHLECLEVRFTSRVVQASFV